MRSLIPLLILSAISAVFAVLHNHAVAERRITPVTYPLLAFLSSGQKAAMEVERGAARLRGAKSAPDDLKAENERLKADNRRLRSIARWHEGEARRLSSLLDLKRVVPRAKAARIIGLSAGPWTRSATIDRGSRDGVRPGDIVVTEDGVVGQVTTMIGPDTAVLLFLTDSASSAAIRVRRTQVVGVARGNGGSRLSLIYLDKDADIRPGDEILTSGMGGIFPRGLAVGAVIEVRNDISGTGRTATIAPAVDFRKLDVVLVLHSPPGADGSVLPDR